MINYDTYLNSDDGGKQFIMRTMFNQVKFLTETVETLARKVDELEHRKGVPSQLIEMQRRTKPPNFIA